MAGNVWEWTTSEYTDRLEGGKIETEAPDDVARRVLRGGSWGYAAGRCRTSCRGGGTPGGRFNGLGFRLVLDPIQFPEP